MEDLELYRRLCGVVLQLMGLYYTIPVLSVMHGRPPVSPEAVPTTMGASIIEKHCGYSDHLSTFDAPLKTILERADDFVYDQFGPCLWLVTPEGTPNDILTGVSQHHRRGSESCDTK